MGQMKSTLESKVWACLREAASGELNADLAIKCGAGIASNGFAEGYPHALSWLREQDLNSTGNKPRLAFLYFVQGLTCDESVSARNVTLLTQQLEVMLPRGDDEESYVIVCIMLVLSKKLALSALEKRARDISKAKAASADTSEYYKKLFQLV